ncbi:Alpha-L-fucosidase [Arcticibacter svalbardensis MN12-7]|uniref:alpha-L-fucosidase n=1 Tax=Arcticibacter svalbardensis MN12-7 TaxID=1150600 RepID=R9GST9_9SPHI|nr:Alpha-L-fucosidase [Arcticibacter svalbardensis MN12-7]
MVARSKVWAFYTLGCLFPLRRRISRAYKKKGGAEWILNRFKIPVAEYREKAKEFNPVNYDPDYWVKLAKDAGMKYIVITAKHHDGFALFDSKVTDWDIMDATPYGKDLLKPLAEACRKYGMKLGFYYSQDQDWTHPGGSVARRLTREGWGNPDSTKIDAYTKSHNGHWDPIQDTQTFDQYINKIAVPQVKEILSNYGDIAVLWWDTPENMTDENALKLQALLKLLPNIITNDRLKHPNFPGDTRTPEQQIPSQHEMDGKNWETCMTMNGTWGYSKADTNWKSTKILLRNLIDIASKGGNYLLNIGPKPDGTFPEVSIERLEEIGKWMKINSEAIYGTKASPVAMLPWGRCTAKLENGNTALYFSVFDFPKTGKVLVPKLYNRVLNARFLNGDKKLKVMITKEGLIIDLPASYQLNDIATVVKIMVKGDLINKN